jgi:microcystin-dependent protein
MKTTTRSLLATPLRIALAGLLTLAAVVPSLRAADGNPPDKLTYQGYLVDSGGAALGTAAPKNYDVIFRVYNHETASGANYRLWTEMQTVTVDKGYFSIVLGEGGAYGTEAHPAISTLFTNQLDASDRFIEMTVRGIGAGGTDSTILPRLRLMTVPYAQLTKTAVNAKYLINVAGGQIVSVSGTNVGINRPSPASALDVNGTVTATALNVSGGVTLSGAVAATTVTATTVTGTAVNGTTITASTAFVGPGTIPVGGIIMWSGTAVPAGWALCNGQSSSGQQTPDLRGRFILSSGSGSGLSARSLGQTGGEENHALTTSELPAHSHPVDPPSTTTSENGDHTHSSNVDRSAGSAGGTLARGVSSYDGYKNIGNETGDHTHTLNIAAFTSGNSGGGTGHNTMPPYYVLAFIMRVQ